MSPKSSISTARAAVDNLAFTKLEKLKKGAKPSGGQVRDRSNVRHIISKVCGQDDTNLVKGLQAVLLDEHIVGLCTPFLSSLAATVNALDVESRRKMVHALREDGYSQSQIRGAGWTCGDDLFSNRDPGKQGRPGIHEEIKDHINEQLHTCSQPSSKVLLRESYKRGETVLKRVKKTYTENKAARAINL